jgi:hypothetical protein
MAQRTDQQIMDDFALSDTVVSEEKGNNPPNFNQHLILEVLLDIREKLDEVKAAIEAI